MIHIQCWNQKRKTLCALSLDELRRDGAQLLTDGNVLWIDLDRPTPEEEGLVFQQFLPVHPLTLEDVTRLRREPDAPPHLPKVEEFPDYLFIIANPLRPHYREAVRQGEPAQDESRDRPLTQLSAVLTETVLITHHFEPLAATDHLRDHLARNRSQCDRGPDYLFHLILDYTVDEFVPVLDAIGDDLDAIEGAILQNPQQRLFARLLHLKRQIVKLRKALLYQREVLVRLARGEFTLVDERERVYYRNVYDHLVRFTELIETSREMVSDLMQTHLSVSGNRLNEVMKILAVISTIGLVCTVISGVYGMNFDPDASPLNMPELRWFYGYPFALGLMASAVALTLVVFRWKKWI